MAALLLLSAAKESLGQPLDLDRDLLAHIAVADEMDRRADVMVEGVPLFKNGVPPAKTSEWIVADQSSHEAYSLRVQASELPARTPAGLQAKARLVLQLVEQDGLASEMALSLARDVLKGA